MMTGYKPFTHRVYVDFSGDDGDYDKPGASKCICIAWVLSKEEDIEYNQGVLLKIKDTIRCNHKDELKYLSLRRHKRKGEALGLLAELKVKVVIAPVFKKYLNDEEFRNPHTKRLVNFIHTFPLKKFRRYMISLNEPVYFQLIFDEISWLGCRDGINDIFKQDKELEWGKERPDWLIFSKSKSNPMIQLADIISGIGREFCEGLIGKTLPPCFLCVEKHRMNQCPYKKGKLYIPNANLFRLLKPLLLMEDAKYFERGFVVRPPDRADCFRFVDCI